MVAVAPRLLADTLSVALREVGHEVVTCRDQDARCRDAQQAVSVAVVSGEGPVAAAPVVIELAPHPSTLSAVVHGLQGGPCEVEVTGLETILELIETCLPDHGEAHADSA